MPASFRGLVLTRAVRAAARRVHQSAYYAGAGPRLGVRRHRRHFRASPSVRKPRRRAEAMLAQHGVTSATDRRLRAGRRLRPRQALAAARVAEVIARSHGARRDRAFSSGAAGDRDAGREIESSLPAGVRASSI